MTLKEFLIVTYKNKDYYHRPMIVCNDGFSMSLQGSSGHYSSPRENSNAFSALEIGFPSSFESLIIDFAENQDDPTNTVYGFVYTNTIQDVITKHKGINVEKTFKV